MVSEDNGQRSVIDDLTEVVGAATSTDVDEYGAGGTAHCVDVATVAEEQEIPADFFPVHGQYSGEKWLESELEHSLWAW